MSRLLRRSRLKGRRVAHALRRVSQLAHHHQHALTLPRREFPPSLGELGQAGIVCVLLCDLLRFRHGMAVFRGVRFPPAPF